MTMKNDAERRSNGFVFVFALHLCISASLHPPFMFLTKKFENV